MSKGSFALGQDKVLASEPGGAFGVQTPRCRYLMLFCSAYFAALCGAISVTAGSKTSQKESGGIRAHSRRFATSGTPRLNLR
ncbi:MAG: hypothetical protein QOJ40_2417 [Verrucomicrobiota bacterium]